MSADRKPIAFISHHSSQEQTARHLKQVLERNGVTGWMAPDDVEPGVAFDQAIIEQVERSDLIVLLFCSKSDQSRHVKRELMMAENHNKLIYPVRLEDIDAKGLAYWLNDYQWIDWIDRRDATIKRLIDTIKRQVAAVRTDETEAPPAEPEAPPAAAAPPAVPPASPPPPGDTAAPMALAGAPENAAPAARRRFDPGRKGWIAIGGGAVLAAILLALLIGGGGPEGFRAGRWESNFQVVEILEPSYDPQTAQALIAQMNADPITTECVSEDVARGPSVEFFDANGEGNCEMDELRMDDGDIHVELSCRPPDLNGGTSHIVFDGRYTRSRLNGEVVSLLRDGSGQQMRIRSQVHSRRTGRC